VCQCVPEGGQCPIDWVMISRLDSTLIKKKIKFSSFFLQIQSVAVVKLYMMRKGFLIYEEMRKYFRIYKEAVALFRISLYMRKILLSLLSVYSMF
jgi:hypothetical protein